MSWQKSLARLLAAVALSGCAGNGGVHTESADGDAAVPPSATVATPDVTAPPSSAASAVPETTEPSADTEPADTGASGTAPSGPPTTLSETEASTSSGDTLFPELGSADLDVQSYLVQLSYDPATQVFGGTITIVTDVVRPLDQIALDAAGLTVESVTVDGAAATFEQTASELLITPATPVAPGTPVTIAVTYSDHAEGMGSDVGLDIGWFPTPTGSYVLNEPDGLRTWMPSNDHPSDKATWRFELTVPTGTTAVANGHLVEQQEGAGTTTWVWEQVEPMSTYLVQVLTGDYQILDGGMAGDTPLTNVALTSDVERMQAYFDLTAEQIEFFEPYFGPYPLDGYGLAFTDSEPGLAMETQGRSLFSRDDFPDGDTGYVEQLLLSHELAHQWFGDAVSPADWSDLWLNESFASYGEWMWLDHVGLQDLESAAQVNLTYRQQPTEPTGAPTVPNLFGYERYEGGAVVLHALRQHIGDDAFFTVLQRWVADNDGQSRTSADFIALAEEVSGTPLAEFFDEWLYAPAVPAEYPG